MGRKREQTVPWHPPRERFPGPVSAEKLGEIFSDCYDFERRELVLPGGVRGELVFLDGLTSGKEIAEYVLRPLTEQDRFGGVTTPEQAVQFMMSGRVYGYTVKRRQALAQVVDDLLNGFCAVVFDDAAVAVTFEVRATDKRSIDEPKEEKSMKGSKDVFIEILKVNSMLVRRRLHEPMLRFHQMTVGRRTRTAVTVVYIQGLTDPALVREMRRRLARIDVDGAAGPLCGESAGGARGGGHVPSGDDPHPAHADHDPEQAVGAVSHGGGGAGDAAGF
jgi:spore germination protein KA